MDAHQTKPARPSRPAHPRRLFTLETANKALPLIERIMRDVAAVYDRIGSLERELHTAGSQGLSDAVAAVRCNHDEQLEKLRELAEEVDAIGCELKDGEKGLIDFRAIHEGREVYLCWRVGEPRVEHWHELDAGFAGRRKLD